MLKAKKIIILILSVILIFSCFCISASAATVYKININQPRADNYSGYIEYLIQTTDGAIVPFVSFWHITGSSNFLDDVDIAYPTVCITVSANRIYLCAIYEGTENNSSYSFSLNGGSVNGYGGSNYWSVTSSTTTADTNAYIGTGTILAYKLYGNYKSLNSISTSSLDFNISYSETSVLYEALLTMAQASASSSGAITQNATENADKIQQNQDENTDDIINNQNDNTQAIIDNQNQLQEQEKAEAESSGNSGADELTGIMPNESQGFIDALGNFVSTMSTTETECSLTFPSIKVPELSGLFPETVLTSEIKFTFSDAIKLIPGVIMKVIQSITTIALIVFCFKELYNTISEALTRKKDTNE